MEAKHTTGPGAYYSPTQTPMREAVATCGLTLNRLSKTSQRVTLLDDGVVVYDGCDLYVFDFLKSEYGLVALAKATGAA